MRGLAAFLAVVCVFVVDARLQVAVAQEGGLVDAERELALLRERYERVLSYAEREEQDALLRARKDFSEAETQFLLDNFEGCTALLLDVIATPAFRTDELFPQALYYLGESLFQTSGFAEARRYLTEAVNLLPPGRLSQNSLSRLIMLAERMREPGDVDELYARARARGSVRSEIVYRYGKWTAERVDLPFAERLKKAEDAFASIPRDDVYYARASFYRGALKVREARPYLERANTLARQAKGYDAPEHQAALRNRAGELLEEASARFQGVLELDPESFGATTSEVQRSAQLALARIAFEQARYLDAVDYYGRVPKNSDEYADAVYELAATYVKLGRYDQAIRAAEIFLLIARESTGGPEARLLLGHLQLQASQFDKASESFDEVLRLLAPVREQVHLLTSQPDPVAHLDALLKGDEASGDIRQLLPPLARPWIDGAELTAAQAVGDELEVGKSALAEAETLAKSLLDTLDSAQLNLFPGMQESVGQVIQLSNALMSLEARLVHEQTSILRTEIGSGFKSRLDKLEQEREELGRKFASLPRTEAQYEERKARFLRRVAELEEMSFDIRRQIGGMRAELTGLRRYWDETAGGRSLSAAQEAERASEFRQYLTLISQLEEARLFINKELATERATAVGHAVGGELEEELRGRYRAQLHEMEALVREAIPALSRTDAERLARINSLRADVGSLQDEVTGLRNRLQERAKTQAAHFRDRIREEQQALESHAKEVASVEGEARHFVGEVALESFRNVAATFDRLMLQADVGLVDVAWAHKQDRSHEVSSLVQDREAALRELRQAFSEVLVDDD